MFIYYYKIPKNVNNSASCTVLYIFENKIYYFHSLKKNLVFDFHRFLSLKVILVIFPIWTIIHFIF